MPGDDVDVLQNGHHNERPKQRPLAHRPRQAEMAATQHAASRHVSIKYSTERPAAQVTPGVDVGQRDGCRRTEEDHPAGIEHEERVVISVCRLVMLHVERPVCGNRRREQGARQVPEQVIEPRRRARL